MAVLLERARAYRGRLSPVRGTDMVATIARYRDGMSVSGWVYEGMAYAVATGLLRGQPSGPLLPTATATRVQAAAVLVRLLFGPSAH